MYQILKGLLIEIHIQLKLLACLIKKTDEGDARFERERLLFEFGDCEELAEREMSTGLLCSSR